MSTASLTALCNATIMTGEAVVEGHALLTRNGIVADIVGNRHVPTQAEKIDCSGQILAPGLIDAQVNGGDNLLLNNDPTPATCLAIAKAHRKHGTTGLLLTCISDTPEITKQAVAAVREIRKTDPSILGIHLEGPHLGLERRGVHNSQAIRSLKPEDLALYRREGDEVMLVTLAPESVAPESVKVISQHNIVSIGHTNALAEQIKVTIESGAKGFTHLFNGMGSMSAREPGVAGIALDDRDSWCSIIADGHHVAPEMIRLALRAKPPGKIFLVSDAMPPAASSNPRPFPLYDKMINVQNGRCISSDGKLAGSAITMLDAVRYCVQKVGVELDETLRMASTYPAAFLGLDKKLGKLLPHFIANVVVLNHKLELQNVWSSL